ncbi:MAG: glycosyltransferase family 2 protein, partial [Bacteroidetes bacterium]|nr:glycosyltransferase family 2 protein [Bacteroidota bacterium]
LNYHGFSVVVIDNNSVDDSVKEILLWLKDSSFNFNEERGVLFVDDVTEPDSFVSHIDNKELMVVCSDKNKGFAAACNIGMKIAIKCSCEKIWLLNNDTVVEKNSLAELDKKIEESADIGVCGSVLVYYPEMSKVQAVGGVKYKYWCAKGNQIGDGVLLGSMGAVRWADEEISYVSGASMLVKRAYIQDVGLMEEKYFLYYEELDWAYRSRRRWRNAVAINSVIYHKVGASIGTKERSKMSQYYMIRGLIMFYRSNLPHLCFVAVMRSIYETLVLVIRKKWFLCMVSIMAIVDGMSGRCGDVSKYRSL